MMEWGNDGGRGRWDESDWLRGKLPVAEGAVFAGQGRV